MVVLARLLSHVSATIVLSAGRDLITILRDAPNQHAHYRDTAAVRCGAFGTISLCHHPPNPPKTYALRMANTLERRFMQTRGNAGPGLNEILLSMFRLSAVKQFR